MYIYIFKDNLSGKYLYVESEAEAADLFYRVSIYTQTRQFQYLGRVTEEKFNEAHTDLRAKVKEETEKITQHKDDEGGKGVVCTDKKRMAEIRANQLKYEQVILAKLSEDAEMTTLKKKTHIFMDKKAEQAMMGTTKIQI